MRNASGRDMAQKRSHFVSVNDWRPDWERMQMTPSYCNLSEKLERSTEVMPSLPINGLLAWITPDRSRSGGILRATLWLPSYK